MMAGCIVEYAKGFMPLHFSVSGGSDVFEVCNAGRPLLIETGVEDGHAFAS
jgi:hypothetical protein